MTAMYKGDELHPPQPFFGKGTPEEDAAWERVRARQDKLDQAIRKKKEALQKRVDSLAEAIASDPARFRALLGLQTDEDRAREAAQTELFETWRNARIKAARLEREAQDV